MAVSAVQFSTGLRMPVESMTDIAHRHGAAVFVDAIQAVGATPFDASRVDYVATGGQKWLMGPPGTGLLYARDWSTLNPTMAGWLSHEDGLCFLWGDPNLMDYDRALQVGPAMVEGGTLNFCGLAGLTASMRPSHRWACRPFTRTPTRGSTGSNPACLSWVTAASGRRIPPDAPP